MKKNKKIGLFTSLVLGSVTLASTTLLVVSCTNNTPTISSFLDTNKIQTEINKMNQFTKIDELVTNKNNSLNNLLTNAIVNQSDSNKITIKTAKAELVKQAAALLNNNGIAVDLKISVTITNNDTDYDFEYMFKTQLIGIDVNVKSIQEQITNLFKSNEHLKLLETKFTKLTIINTFSEFTNTGITKSEIKSIDTNISGISVDDFVNQSTRSRETAGVTNDFYIDFAINLNDNIVNYNADKKTWNQEPITFRSESQITLPVSSDNTINYKDSSDTKNITGLSEVGKKQKSISTPTNTTQISNIQSEMLETLDLSKSDKLTKIGASAFANNSKMNNIIWPQKNNIKEVGANAFSSTGFNSLDLTSFNLATRNSIFLENSLANIKSNISSTNNLTIKVQNKESAESLISTNAFGKDITLENAEESGYKFTDPQGKDLIIKPENPASGPFGQSLTPVSPEVIKQADPNGLIKDARAVTDGGGNTILSIQATSSQSPLPTTKESWSIQNSNGENVEFQIDKNRSTNTSVRITIQNTPLDKFENSDLSNIKFSFKSNNSTSKNAFVVTNYEVNNRLEFKYRSENDNYIVLEKLMGPDNAYEIKPRNPIGRVALAAGIPLEVINNPTGEINKFISQKSTRKDDPSFKQFLAYAQSDKSGIVLTEIKQ